MKANQARRDLSRRAAGVLILRLDVTSFCQNACRVFCRAASKASHSNRNDASRELRADGGAHLTCPTSQRPANRCRHCQASSPIRGTSCTPSQAPVCAACTKRTRCTWRHFYAVLHIWEANGTCLVHKAKTRQASPEKDRNPRQHEYHSVWQSSLCESSRLGGAEEEGLRPHR